MYSCYKLTEAQRALLFQTFAVPDGYDRIGDHVTRTMKPNADSAQPGEHADVRVIGYVANDRVAAAIVLVNGAAERPHGGYFHITLGVNRAIGAKPVESNAAVERAYQDGTANSLPSAIDLGFCVLALKDTAPSPPKPKDAPPSRRAAPIEREDLGGGLVLETAAAGSNTKRRWVSVGPEGEETVAISITASDGRVTMSKGVYGGCADAEASVARWRADHPIVGSWRVRQGGPDTDLAAPKP